MNLRPRSEETHVPSPASLAEDPDDNDIKYVVPESSGFPGHIREKLTQMYGPAPTDLELPFRQRYNEPFDYDNIRKPTQRRIAKRAGVLDAKRTRNCPKNCTSFLNCDCGPKRILEHEDKIQAQYTQMVTLLREYLDEMNRNIEALTKELTTPRVEAQSLRAQQKMYIEHGRRARLTEEQLRDLERIRSFSSNLGGNGSKTRRSETPPDANEVSTLHVSSLCIATSRCE